MKYIDAEKLKEEIEGRRKFHDDAVIKFCNNRTIALTHSAGLKEDEELIELIDSLQQEQPSLPSNLDEAAETYSKEVSNGHSYRDLICGFKAGAEWQKEQMLKDVVEGVVCATITGTNAISFLSPLPKELTAGDKVRIVILKQKEE